MRVALLGPLEVETSDGSRQIAGGRLRALLSRLAVAEGRIVSTAELIDAVWAEDAPGGAGNALQSLVSRLRRSLGHAESILQAATGYRLAITRTEVDAARFTDQVRAGQQQLATDRHAEAVRSFDAALRLWRGEPLPDAGDAGYALGYRKSWRALRARAEEDRLAALLGTGSFDDVVADAEVLAMTHPLNERVASALLRGLAGAGRIPEALVAYENLRTRLRDDLGADPGPELQSLHLRLLRGGVGEPPTAPTAAAPTTRRTNLRTALTSFVGREDDLDRALTNVRTQRLATLIGAGGSGKTRMAVEVGWRWLDTHPGSSVWLVELAPVTGGDDLVAAVLGALGVRDTRLTERTDRPAPDARERLLDRLRDTSCLLVMDNCEHLVDAVARLVDEILAAAPDVRVLATSRELLGLTGEMLCPIAPLPLPPVEVDLANAAGYPAVRLWLDRAAAARPDFVLDESTLSSVIEIVRRLDGLPLAIELAAARLRVLSVIEIARRLSDRFRLLTGGNRTSLPRHRTLRAVVDWSWDLLSTTEQLLAERLSVFPAGADGGSIHAVCADARLPAADIEDVLGSLVDKSLVQADAVARAGALIRKTAPSVPAWEGTVGTVRYRMLETIREYGIERLAERDELDAARLAHADHFAAIVLECEPVLRSRAQLTALARLELERDNIAAGLRYLATSDRGDQALAMLLALAWYWTILDNNTELAGWAGPILEANPGADLPGLAYARAALVMVDLGERTSEQRLTWDAVRERLAGVAEELAATPDAPFPGLEVLRCMIAAFAGREDVAELLVDRALAADDPWVRAALQVSLASIYENAGELDRMRSSVASAYQEFVEIGDRWGLSTALVARSQLATMDGRLDEAIDDLTAARSYLRELRSANEDVYLSLRLADLLIRCGDFEGARREVAELQDLERPGLDSERALFGKASLIMIEWHGGRRMRARELAAQARVELAGRHASAAMMGHLRAVTLAATGLVAALDGDVAQATADLRAAYPSAIETRDHPIIAGVGTAVAGWLTARSLLTEAAVALGAAAVVRGSDDPTDRAVVTLSELLEERLGSSFTRLYAEGRTLDRVEAQQRLDPVRYL